MMLLASTSSPAAMSASTCASGTRSIVIAASSALTAARVRASSSVARNRYVYSSQKPGRVVELAQRLEAPGPVPDLLLELAVRGRLGRLALDVALARRHLEQLTTGGDAPLTHEHRVAVDHRDDDDRARMVHDVPVELVTVAVGDAQRATPTGSRRRRACSEPTTRNPARRRSPGVGRLGVDRQREARAADRRPVRGPPRTNAANSGCGRSGRLLNSGWAWVPTKNGWLGQLDELDQPVVGRGARAHEPGLLEPAAVLVVDLVAVAVALVDDFLAVRPLHDRTRQQLRRVEHRGAWCRPCRRRCAARP